MSQKHHDPPAGDVSESDLFVIDDHPIREFPPGIGEAESRYVRVTYCFKPHARQGVRQYRVAQGDGGGEPNLSVGVSAAGSVITNGASSDTDSLPCVDTMRSA